MAIPTRLEIINKIAEIKASPTFSGGQEVIYSQVSAWLDQVSCPAVDKEKILDDLASYPNY